MRGEVVTGLFLIAATLLAGYLGRGPIRLDLDEDDLGLVRPSDWFTPSKELVAAEKAQDDQPDKTARALADRIAALETRTHATEPTTDTKRADDEHAVEVLSTRVSSLQSTVSELRAAVEGAPEAAPVDIPSVLAAEGAPLDAPVGLRTAKAASTDDRLDADGKRVYQPEYAIDGNTGTHWVGKGNDLANMWFDIALDQYRKVTGIRFLSDPNATLSFYRATIVLNDSHAQKVQLTDRQRNTKGWFYFPIDGVDTDSLRILFTEYQAPWSSLPIPGFDGHPIFGIMNAMILSEVEIYGQ